MNKNRETISVSFLLTNLLLVSLFISSCGPGQLFGPKLTFTPTITLTSTITLTPTITPTLTITPTPTPTVEEMIEVAVQIACEGKPATSVDVGASKDQPASIRLCDDDSIPLPVNWIATTPGNLQYVIDFEDGSIKIGSCPYTGGHSLIRWKLYTKIIVYNSITGALVRQTTLYGSNQDPCPSTYSFSSTSSDLYGDSVPPQAIQDGIIHLLSPLMAEPSLPKTLKGHTFYVSSVAFSPDGTFLASGSYDSTVRLWDVDSGTKVYTLKGHTFSVTSVTFSPDGTLLASASWDDTVKIWDVASGHEVLTLKGHTADVNIITFSLDGTLLASGSSDGTVKLWDLASGNELQTLEGYLIGFLPDGKSLVFEPRDDNTVMLWDVDSGKEIRTITLARTLRLDEYILGQSPDGKWLFSSGADYSLKLWDMVSGKEAYTLKGHTAPVSSVAFSPDGTLMASGSHDDTLRLWDVANESEVLMLVGRTDYVTSIAFSPDGTLLAWGNYADGTVQVSEIKTP